MNIFIGLFPAEKVRLASLDFLDAALRLCCLCVCVSSVAAHTFKPSSFVSHAVRDEAAAQTSPLNVFEVHQPVLNTSSGDYNGAQQILMNHSFGFSYGQPFVGNYNPPSFNFNRVVFNLTVVSAGRQFDRLGIIYFGDTEIFRTSTAEPTANGIEWTYMKDMTAYWALFKSPQKIIFDLGNLIDDTYTGAFNATLTAVFLTEAPGDAIPADVIVPISARLSSSDRPSAFSLPSQNASNLIAIPQNARRAVFTIAACGQADEEFWYTNVLDSDVLTFPSSGPLLGHSPFREVQLYIDGKLAGVQWPFPVIFTGGIVPGFWRPIVGINAFDLPEHEIDITPWLPLLTDGADHTFEIRVAGLTGDNAGSLSVSSPVGNYWVVTGKVFVWLDESNNRVQSSKGSIPKVIAPPPHVDVASSVQKYSNGTNSTLLYSVNVNRHIIVSSLQNTPLGHRPVTWTQSLKFSNNGSVYDNGFTQDMSMLTTGTDVSPNGLYVKHYRYPLSVYSTFAIGPNNSLSIDADLARGLDVKTFGTAATPFPFELNSPAVGAAPGTSESNGTSPSFGWKQLHTTQNGSAHYLSIPSQKTSTSWGTTEQKYSFKLINNFFSPRLSSSSLPLYDITNDLMVPLGGNGGTTVDNDPDLDPDLDSVAANYKYKRHVIATNGHVVQDEETINGSASQFSESPGRIDAAAQQDFAPEGVEKLLGRGNYW